MKQVTESALFKRIKPLSPGVVWDRVESPLTSPGIPDCIASHNKQVEFVELKSGPKFKWRADQRSWARRHCQHARVWLLISRPDGSVILWRVFPEVCEYSEAALYGANSIPLEKALGWVLNNE